MRLNYWVVYCGGSVMSNPPALTGVEAPAEVGKPETPSTTAVDIKDDYEAKYGAVGAGNCLIYAKTTRRRDGKNIG